MKAVGVALLALMTLVAVAAPWLAPNPPDRRFPDLLYAPPTPVHVVRPDGTPGRPYIHPVVLVSRLERTFEPDRSRMVDVRWFENGRLLSVPRAASTALAKRDGVTSWACMLAEPSRSRIAWTGFWPTCSVKGLATANVISPRASN